MTRGLIFWVLMLVWLVFGILSHFGIAAAYTGIGSVVLFFILTAFESPLYALGVGQTTDYVERHEFVAASSGLLFAWGLGSCFGPTVAGAVMHELGPQGLLLFAAGCFLFVALFTTYRAMRRRAKTPQEQSDYVAVPLTQGTYGAPELDPRGEYKPTPEEKAAKIDFVE